MAGHSSFPIHNSESLQDVIQCLKPEKASTGLSQLIHILLNSSASAACTWLGDVSRIPGISRHRGELMNSMELLQALNPL